MSEQSQPIATPSDGGDNDSEARRTTPVLGRLEKVPLRDVWAKEAYDFTPWLAEHLPLLSEALDTGPLTLVGTEQSVGPFSIDIVATTADGQHVVIENQLERSDHTHLGQILTYAAGMDASIIVWVLPELQNEHRSALDWMNEHTDSEVNFFGVVVEVVRIGASAPAPVFRVEARPNDWQKQVRSTKASAPWRGWDLAYAALAAVPAGAWTSIQDLAELVGTSPGWIGRHMYNRSELPNYHRMLNQDGTVWKWYRKPGATEPSPEHARELLTSEGLVFTNDRADDSKRLDDVALSELISELTEGA